MAPVLPYKVAIQYQWDRQFQDSCVRQVTPVLPGGMAAKKKENGNDFTTVAWAMFTGSRKMPLRTLAPANADKNGEPVPSETPTSFATFQFTGGYVTFLLESIFIKKMSHMSRR